MQSLRLALPLSIPLSVLTVGLTAPAQDINISDNAGQALFQQNFETSNVAIYPAGSTPELMICDPIGDPLGVSFTSKWCFAVRGVDAREFIFSDGGGQAVFVNTGNVATADWADVDGRGLFSAHLDLRIHSTGPNSGIVIKSMTITNISGSPLPLDMYHFQDIDACGAAFNQNSTTSGIRMSHTTTCGETAEHFAAGANTWETQTSGNLYTRFGDTVRITLLNNTGIVGPGDVRTACGWIGHTIPVGGTRTYNAQLSHNVRACGAFSNFFGEARPTSRGMPQQQIAFQPVLGQIFGVSGSNLVPSSPVIMVLGFQETNVPILGFVLYTSPIATVSSTANATGSYQAGLPIPNNPVLCDFTAYGMMVYLDAGSPNGIGGQSPGFDLHIGDR